VKSAALAMTAMALAFSPAVASAEPVVPQSDSPCSSNYADAMTLPAGARLPLVCQGGRWLALTSPQPPSDRWLSYGPEMTLHGEGRRNPSVKSGEWTATPQDPGTRCRAEQSAVVSAGVVGAPQVAEGQPGQPLEVQLVPRLFDLQLGGNCLWERNA
jgi:hypothetical protein